MKRYPPTTREQYDAIQRHRTLTKWAFNGITREEVTWIRDHVPLWTLGGPILCLGVRNGLEVDLFREVFDCEHVQGVELHEHGARPDVWIGSFDAMPESWAGRFALLYSNAFDHAFDPEATAKEWRRVAQPGAMLALSLPIGNEPTATEPTADITLADVYALFACTLHEHRLHGQLWRAIVQLP